jgi:hypothetical protein
MASSSFVARVCPIEDTPISRHPNSKVTALLETENYERP